MFSEDKTETVVGIVVFAAIIVLTLGIIWGKKFPLFATYRKYNAVFADAQGIEKGDPVMVHGIKKGEVTDIQIYKNKALIEFRLKRTIPLFSDSRVYLEIEDLLGGKQLSVHPGSSEIPLESNIMISGDIRGDIRLFMNKSMVIMYQVDSLLSKMNILFRDNKISQIIDNLKKVSFQTNELLVQNRKNINSTIAVLNSLTRKFQTDSTLDNIHTTVENLNTTVVLLDTTLSRLNPVVKQLQNKETTFGKMVSDKKLYDQLVKTTTNLDSLINDIQKNPKRYIHFSLF